MRVLLLGSANSIHTQRWADVLAARGVEVTLVSQHDPVDWTPQEGAVLRLLPVRGAVGYFANAPAVRSIAHQVRPDLVNAHYASGYGTLAGLVRYRPTLLSVWGSDVFAFPDRSWLTGRLIRWNLRRAQRIASTSRAMAAQVRRLVPDVTEVAITPFGVDTEFFRPRPRTDGESVCTIGTVRTLDSTYGIDILISAFGRALADKEVVASGARLRLLIVGDGPDRQPLERLATRSAPGADVRFVGRVPHVDVPAWLNQMDMFVAPSRSESFGVAVVEASSCGLPVVVSDAGGLPEVVHDGSTGLIVPAGDVAALARAISQLVTDPDMRRRLGSAGRAFVQRQYEWDRCADRMIEWYEAAIQEYPVPSR